MVSKNNQITVDYVIEIVNSLEFDILGIQELDDTTMFNEMLDFAFLFWLL